MIRQIFTMLGLCGENWHDGYIGLNFKGHNLLLAHNRTKPTLQQCLAFTTRTAFRVQHNSTMQSLYSSYHIVSIYL